MIFLLKAVTCEAAAVSAYRQRAGMASTAIALNLSLSFDFLPSFLFSLLSLSSSSIRESQRQHFLSLVSLLLLRASGASNVSKKSFQP